MNQEVEKLIASLPRVEIWDKPYKAHVRGELVDVPQRVIFSKIEEARAAPAYLCLLTRSTDGYVREKALRKLLAAKTEFWILPYFFVSLGEYEISISKLVTGASKGVRDELRSFAAQNPDLVELIKAKAISYWNEYYKHNWPTYHEYPPFQFIESLIQSNEPEADESDVDVFRPKHRCEECHGTGQVRHVR
jgi:hypothetical protein